MADRLRRAGAVLSLITFVAIAPAINVRAAAEEQAVAPAVTEDAAAEEQGIAAVWKSHEVDFMYRSSVAIFTCGALKDRVAAILRGIGARDDVQVRADNCSDSVFSPDISPVGSNSSNPTRTWNTPANAGAWPTASRQFGVHPSDRGSEQLSHVHVRLMFPTEVTPEILAEMDRDKSRRELISRVTGNPAANLNDPIVFAARRELVTLSRKNIGLDPVECELLDQMATTAFRQLDIKVVHRSECSRGSISRIAPQLTAETLVGIPYQTGIMRWKEESDEEEEDEAGSKDTAGSDARP